MTRRCGWIPKRWTCGVLSEGRRQPSATRKPAHRFTALTALPRVPASPHLHLQIHTHLSSRANQLKGHVCQEPILISSGSSHPALSSDFFNSLLHSANPSSLLPCAAAGQQGVSFPLVAKQGPQCSLTGHAAWGRAACARAPLSSPAGPAQGVSHLGCSFQTQGASAATSFYLLAARNRDRGLIVKILSPGREA